MPSPPRLAPVLSGAVAWLRQTWTPKRGRPRTVTGGCQRAHGVDLQRLVTVLWPGVDRGRGS